MTKTLIKNLEKSDLAMRLEAYDKKIRLLKNKLELYQKGESFEINKVQEKYEETIRAKNNQIKKLTGKVEKLTLIQNLHTSNRSNKSMIQQSEDQLDCSKKILRLNFCQYKEKKA